MRARLKRPSIQAQCVLAGAALGAVAFFLLYGFGALNPFNDAWVRGGYVEKDIVQHYTGWLFYRASPWQFPLGMSQGMNYPAGGYVGFTDSIPIFAVLFKLLSPILPATFQYFGLWGLLCSVLQGAAAALLLGLFTQSRLHCILMSSLFVLAPILLDRQLRHTSLGAQWLILFALYLYFKHRRSGRFWSPGFLWLCGLAIAIHPYFVPMLFGLLFALLVQNAVAQRRWWQPLCMLLGCFAATGLAGWVFGAFAGGTGGGVLSYGYYSMNLNAPVNPTSPDTRWSLFLPVLNQTAGNYDGFNYLGLGLLLTLAVMAVDGLAHLKGGAVWRRLKRHMALAAVCLCFTLFAISNTVTLMGRELFTLPLPGFVIGLAANLRSSGRLFYPVWYLLLLAGCLYWLRRPKPRLRTVAAVGLVAVQLVDLSPALLHKAQLFRPYRPAFESALSASGFWQQTQGAWRHLASLDTEGVQHGVDLALYAYDNGMTTDDPFAARYDLDARQAQVDDHLAALREGRPAVDTLYVTSNVFVFLEYAMGLEGQAYCASLGDTWYVLAPYNDAFDGYGGAEAILYKDYPLLIADYYDALWQGGILSTDRRMVCFVDTRFAREKLAGATALVAGGAVYPILEISFKDAGWILVTLDVADAGPLAGQPLEVVR